MLFIVGVLIHPYSLISMKQDIQMFHYHTKILIIFQGGWIKLCFKNLWVLKQFAKRKNRI